MNTYTISELSKRYDVPASTLRYYEEIGLLEDVSHDEKGLRTYDDRHIARLDGIMCFKRAGLSIAGIKEFYVYESKLVENSPKILDMMKKQETVILKNIEDLTGALAHIREKITYYSAVNDAAAKGLSIPAWDDIIKNG